jgi:hypothetical protein
VGGVTAGAVVGFAAGAVVTMSLQGAAVIPPEPVVPSATAPAPSPFVTTREDPDTYLAWTSGGLPPGFAHAAVGLPEVRRVVVVASDNTWLTRSYNEQGEIVDDPPATFAIPLEVAAVAPGAYAPFLPPADRSVVEALADGQGVLGQSSARLRGLGPGAILRFGPVRVRVAAILPDELVGAHELLVSRETGLRIGVVRDRYALLVTEGRPTVDRLIARLGRALPAGTLLQVRAPGDTPYFRHGDAVLPPVALKELFGEFTARPRALAPPGYLTFDPAWVRAHIDTRRVPLLGSVTCNVALFPQIRGAIRELVARGLGDTITSYSGCWAPRHILGDPSANLSHHAWGVALDINVPQNPFGAEPNQDPRLVEVFERWGFVWGGRFVRPDGMHFEYRRPPAES